MKRPGGKLQKVLWIGQGDPLDMLSDEAMDAAIEASGLSPFWNSQGRFMLKLSEPTGQQ